MDETSGRLTERLKFPSRCSLDTDHYMKSLVALGNTPRSSNPGRFLKRLSVKSWEGCVREEDLRGLREKVRWRDDPAKSPVSLFIHPGLRKMF